MALLGIFPIPGLTTLPVMLFIFLFKLNPVAAMLTNYLCTPLNIASVPLFMYVLCCCGPHGHNNDHTDVIFPIVFHAAVCTATLSSAATRLATPATSLSPSSRRYELLTAYHLSVHDALNGNAHCACVLFVVRSQDLKKDPINTLLLFRFTLLNAIYMWLVVLPVLTGLIYVVLTPVLRRLMPKSGAKDEKKAE